MNLETVLAPLVLIAGAFALLGVDLFFKKTPRLLLEGLAYVAVIAAGVALLLTLAGAPIVGFGGAVAFDGLGKFLTLFILVATGLAVMLSPNLASRAEIEYPEFLALLLISSASMALLVIAADFVTLFLSLEIMSLAVYVLSGVTRQEPRANEASIKYFIMGSVASAFLLYGMAIMYGVTGSVELRALASASPKGLPLVGLGLLTVGFAFKVGAVPFHMWVPDVYEGAPTAVTSFMSVAVKAAGFGALLRTVAPLSESLRPHAAAILSGVAIATMIVGNLFAIAQTSVKRMLAYSSVAHTGYALMGAAVAAGAPAFDGATATAFYLLVYTFMTMGAFAALIFAGSGRRDAESFDDFQGLARERPAAALLMSVFMLSLAGVPPLGGFFGKFFLFKTALDAGYIGLVITAVITTLVSVYYYLRVVVVMVMHPRSESASPGSGDPYVGVVLWICALFTLALGLVPNSFLSLASDLLMR